MAQHDETGHDASANGSEPTPAPGDLPQVESPSISPDRAEPADANAQSGEQAGAVRQPSRQLVEYTPPAARTFRLRPRHKRAALLAASVAIAAALGATVGAVTTRSMAARTPTGVADLRQDSRAMQQSIAHLSREVTTLKANLEAANKSAKALATKTTERFAALSEVTGSIASSPQPGMQQAATPLPAPRPLQQQELASVAPPPRPHPLTLPDWTIRSARDGVAYVEGHGEIYQAVLGVPLPGLGPVETIRREDGHWIVVTPKGIIVSSRDRHAFE